MKFIIILFSLYSLASCGKDQYMAKLKKIKAECNQNPATKCSDGWSANGEPYINLEGEGAHIFCRMKKVRSLKPNGDIDEQAMRRDLTSGIPDPKIVEIIVEKCKTRKAGTSPEKSAIDNFRCVRSTYDQLYPPKK